MSNEDFNNENAKKPLDNKSFKSYLKYSGMGFQLIAALAIGGFGGNYLDKYLKNDTPILTLVGLLFMLSAVLYLIIRQISNDK